jgi:glycerophosphoryl diester phosphodiesterase
MTQKYSTLLELFRNANRTVITAHNAYNGHYPENSIVGLRAATEIGVDIIEFDVRGTADNVLVLQHDPTLDRTSNGHGVIVEKKFHEIKDLNFSYFNFLPDFSGTKMKTPRFEKFPITKFEDVLSELSSRVFMNIQVYTQDTTDIKKICALYKEFNLYEKAYLTMGNFYYAEKVRKLDSEIDICITDRPTTIEKLYKFKDFGCRFVQPVRTDISHEFCEKCRELDMFANLYYSNSDEDNRHFIELGIQGILTDYPEILMQTIKDLQEEQLQKTY